MNDTEIIKALKCCSNRYDCNTCEYYIKYCTGDMNIPLKDALDLINRQQAKIKKQKNAIKNFKATKESQITEIYRLKGIIKKVLLKMLN